MSNPPLESKSSFLAPDQMDTIDLPTTTKLVTVDSYGLTYLGNRTNNEDQFAIAKLVKTMEFLHASHLHGTERKSQEAAHLLVVADGLGGHAGGEEASRLAVDAVEAFVLNSIRWFFSLRGSGEQEVLHEFQKAIGAADIRLVEESQKHQELTGMGTTLTMGFLLNNRLYIAHAGDSRCYLYRDHSLHQLTRDHTLLAQMVDNGILTEEDAKGHRFANMLTNVVGGRDAGVQVDVHRLDLHGQDMLLFCSDGLTSAVPDDEIQAIFDSGVSAEAICRELIQAAKNAAARDNVTVVVSRIDISEGSQIQ